MAGLLSIVQHDVRRFSVFLMVASLQLPRDAGRAVAYCRQRICDLGCRSSAIGTSPFISGTVSERRTVSCLLRAACRLRAAIGVHEGHYAIRPAKRHGLVTFDDERCSHNQRAESPIQV